MFLEFMKRAIISDNLGPAGKPWKGAYMDPHYRVAIFGSARIRPEDKEYKDIYCIAKGFAEAGLDVVTGGGPGLMEAANAGHRSAGSGTHSIGLNIKLPFEQEGNRYLDIKKDFDRFSSRLDTFMSLSDAVVVATGGIGTLLELFYSWQLIQVRHVCETPIVLFGDMWGGLMNWLKAEVITRGLFSIRDMDHVFHITAPEEVVRFIKKVYEDRSKVDHICVNYSKYKVEFQ